MPGSLPFPTAALPAAPFGAFCRHGLRFCGLRREGLSLRSLNWAASGRITPDSSRRFSNKILAVVKDNRSPAKVFDYDLVIIGAGVGGHGAAIHAVEKLYSLSCSFWYIISKVCNTVSYCSVRLVHTGPIEDQYACAAWYLSVPCVNIAQYVPY
ncbi:hypothetical protein BHM03_00018687 [Ensete ventricosum]|nr:hypothetical protein BHM03_00018687 [Ensete ventricosum]